MLAREVRRRRQHRRVLRGHQRLDRDRAGRGVARDLDTLLSIADNMTGKTICVLSDSCATPVVSGLQKFRSEFEAKLKASPNVVSAAGAPGTSAARLAAAPTVV